VTARPAGSSSFTVPVPVPVSVPVPVPSWPSNSAVPRAVPSAAAAIVEALTPAYNLLVGGLLVPILDGLLWKRGTAPGALSSVVAGGAAVVGLMAWKGILANEPVYYGLLGPRWSRTRP
jgi:hypothetical protein